MIKFLQTAPVAGAETAAANVQPVAEAVAETATPAAETTAEAVADAAAEVAAQATEAVAPVVEAVAEVQDLVEPTFFEKYANWILIILMIVIFYFFMIRPQQKARKKEQEMRDSLKAGDKVMTIGGIYGVIKKVDEDSFLLEVDGNVTLRVAKQAVTLIPTASK